MIRTSMRLAARRRRRALAALVPVGALLLALFVMSGPASADTYYLPTNATPVNSPIHTTSGQPMCLDNEGGILANYNAVDIYPCNGQPNQVWLYEPRDQSLRLAFAPWMCLDVSRAGTSDGDSVGIYVCNGTLAQQWIAGYYTGTLYNVGSRKCLDDPNLSQAPDTHLEIWDCNGGANQVWNFS